MATVLFRTVTGGFGHVAFPDRLSHDVYVACNILFRRVTQ